MSSDTETLRRRAETGRRLRAGVGVLSTVTLQRLDARLPWYRSMAPSDRSWVGHLAQSGISSFIDWYRHPDTDLRVVSEIFKSAPRDLIRAISLHQTLQLLKVVVEVVEERVPDIARTAEQSALREAVLIYS
ncbi:PucR family transcriptional regulator, partial [Burkholderia multivorans]